MLAALMALGLAAAPMPAPILNADLRAMSDAEIMGLVAQVDAAEIEEGKLATTKAGSEAVRSYGRMIVADHQKSMSEGRALAQRIHVTPVLTPDADMARDHAAEMVKLNGLSGAAFDREFLQHCAADHKQVIDKVEHQLIPDAQNAELKAHLRAILPTLQKHETRAEADEKQVGSAR